MIKIFTIVVNYHRLATFGFRGFFRRISTIIEIKRSVKFFMPEAEIVNEGFGKLGYSLDLILFEDEAKFLYDLKFEIESLKFVKDVEIIDNVIL